MDTVIESLLRPVKLWSRDEVLARPSPVSKCAGVYAWFFRRVPPIIPVADCLIRDGYTLLYIGISPKAPPANGAPASRENLSSRIRYHMRGNAEGSTLRLTLGCLLSNQLGIELRRVGSGTRMTFSAGEASLSTWMAENARVCWASHPEPWVPEEKLIRTISLPFNLDQNSSHCFHSALSLLRRQARMRARVLPCV